MNPEHGNDTIHDMFKARLQMLEDYIYKLEREICELTQEVLMWRIKDDPDYLSSDDSEPS